MGNNYIFVFLTPVINLFLFELFFYNPQFFYISLILVNLLILFSIKKITKRKITEIEFWNLLILPVMFSSSLMIFSILLSTKFFVQFLFIVNFFFTYYYLKNTHFREKEPDHRKSFFENISSYGNFLILFFIASSAYGLRSFLGIPIWTLILVMVIAILLIVYEAMWANKIEIKTGGIYIFIFSLILIQIAWSIYFLPLNHNTLGLILAICYYILIGLTKFFLRDNLDRRTVKLYLIFGFSSIILILLTAKWV